MFRVALHNVLIMLGIALPILLIAGPLVGWMLAWGGDGRIAGPSINGLLASIVFWYPVWAVPALAVAGIHQLVLLALPRRWAARMTRLVILATSLAMGAVIAAYVAIVSTVERGWALAAALLPSTIAYGILAKPLRSQSRE